MLLPQSVRLCLDRLTEAGFPTYAVGGCVRDSLLGIPPQDYDLCTQAAPAQIQAVFQDLQQVLSGVKHGTVGVVVQGQVIEITTFRTEGAYRDNRHPAWVRFVDSLTEDLSRRDFTVNAIAYSPAEGYIDPFGGREDLRCRVLRCVGEPTLRFQEDALRILRGVRFAVRFGLTPESATKDALFSQRSLMDNLARERVFDELCKLLPLVNAQDLLTYAPVLTQVLPELAPSVGFLQHSPHHAYDVFTHTAYVVEAVPPTLVLRWAALLHDTGKPASFTQDETGRGHFKGHAAISARLADQALRRLKAPTVLREQAVALIERHMTPLPPDKPILRRRCSRYGVDGVFQLLALQKADFTSKGVKNDGDPSIFPRVEALLAQILAEGDCLQISDLAIGGKELIGLGYSPGPRLGDCLSHLLRLVQEDRLPNEKAALLQAAGDYFSR